MKFSKKTMIGMLALSLATMTANSAQAGMLGMEVKNNCGDMNFPCMVFTIITSGPTLTVQGVQLDTKSEEVGERLKSEARGDVDPILLSNVAKTVQHPVGEVKNAVLSLEKQGQDVTVEAVIGIFQKNLADSRNEAVSNVPAKQVDETVLDSSNFSSATTAGAAR
ncbi:MAG: hypothetical protein A2428_10065 [Bdellovibrionales bacterium RIFOXYC1_FULL_54_43]|nr:MAG: hypothetical protein A2428_10065 [Bdellovibrionales bacterium RIFOXYC1_FULL_54_43]OFZ80528.1 MAG: hypothetical protein A2603_13160 [Bdellovibrionales bacterium RIFOXYD1_FULL_55_31]